MSPGEQKAEGGAGEGGREEGRDRTAQRERIRAVLRLQAEDPGRATWRGPGPSGTGSCWPGPFHSCRVRRTWAALSVETVEDPGPGLAAERVSGPCGREKIDQGRAAD
jgi:hypothetical protein